MLDLIIKNGNVVFEHAVKKCDISVQGNKIIEIAPHINEQAITTIDATDKIVMPGMIDTHFHASDPGGSRSDWEGYITGTQALAKGGVTSFLDMPLNNLPATVDGATLSIKKDNAAKKCYVDYGFFGGVIPDNQKKLKELVDGGVHAFKAFMSSCGDRSIADDFRNVSDYELFRAMEELAKLDGLLCIHAENADITDRLGAAFAAEGKISMLDYVHSRPTWTETEAVMRAIILAKATGVRLHIMHVSNPETIRAIQAAQKQGNPVTFESCPHYFLFCHDDFATHGVRLKCSPPIRSKEEQDTMWQMLLNGDIPVLSSDHSPCPPAMKDHESAFAAWGGIAGAQNSVDIMFSEAVMKRGMPVWDFAKVLSTNPAKIYNIKNKGKIEVGYDADFAIIDTQKPYTLTDNMLMYQNKFSPYVGWNINCSIAQTIVRGNIVYDYESGLTSHPVGQMLY